MALAGARRDVSMVGSPEDIATFVQRMRTFFRADQVIAATVLIVGVIVGFTVVDSGWTYAVAGAMAANIGIAEYCHRSITVDNFKAVSLGAIASLWLVCLAIAPLVSFGLPALIMVVVISLLAPVPILNRTEVATFTLLAAMTLGLIATLAYSIEGPIDEQIPDWLGNLITTVAIVVIAAPLAVLAWDIHLRHATALDRMARANDELRESRARLVDVADDERRRIERNLHDGAQQRFVGLTMHLRLLAREHPEVADDVGPLVNELKEALEEVRALAHGIYPPLLKARGLPEALTAAARRSPIEVTVIAETTQRYSERVEVAVYFVFLEAIQNAAKYGDEATTVSVDLSESGNRLSLRVADDGPGFDPETTPPGHGLRNMSDRLAAVEATLTVESAVGAGTRLSTAIELAGQPD